MISITLVLYLLFLHYVADFLCQSSEMALNKHHSNGWLTLHVTVYTVIFFWGLFIWPIGNRGFNAYGHLGLFTVITFVTHWVTDYFTSRCNAQLWQLPSKRHFFRALGWDQLVHGVTLVLTAGWLLT